MPHEVHLSEPIGAFNTFVLICSSVTIVLALEAAKANKAGAGQGLDAADASCLGSVFLGVKVYEYNAKFSHGIYPRQAAQPDLRKGRPVLRRGGAAAAGRARSSQLQGRRTHAEQDADLKLVDDIG